MEDEKSIQQHWETRARQYGNSLRGVLFQGLPDGMNEVIHHWHTLIVQDCFASLLPVDAKVSDIGCGYGRLSRIVRRERPQSRLLGLDLNPVYCRTYKETIGPAVCGSAAHPPWPPACWDGALVVTTLMYVDRPRCREAVKAIVSSLRPGGIALFVDPGLEIAQLQQKIRPESSNKPTSGKGFRRSEYLDLFENAHVSVLDKGSNAFFTAFLPIMLLSGRWPSIARFISDRALWLDQHIQAFTTFALHRWVMVRRDD
jgi:SAM-dependent methyltransferase